MLLTNHMLTTAMLILNYYHVDEIFQVYGLTDTNKANLISLLNFIESDGTQYGIHGHGLMQVNTKHT